MSSAPGSCAARWQPWLEHVAASPLGGEAQAAQWRAACESADSASDAHARALIERLIREAIARWSVAEALHAAPEPNGATGAPAVIAAFAADACGSAEGLSTSSPEMAGTLAGVAHGALAGSAGRPAASSAAEQIDAQLMALEHGHERAADTPAFSDAVRSALAAWAGTSMTGE